MEGELSDLSKYYTQIHTLTTMFYLNYCLCRCMCVNADFVHVCLTVDYVHMCLCVQMVEAESSCVQ